MPISRSVGRSDSIALTPPKNSIGYSGDSNWLMNVVAEFTIEHPFEGAGEAMIIFRCDDKKCICLTRDFGVAVIFVFFVIAIEREVVIERIDEFDFYFRDSEANFFDEFGDLD